MDKMNFDLRECKFAQDGEAMAFEGYGAVFGNVDFGGDVIEPGAFSDTITQHKNAGTMPAMLYEHGKRGGGPAMPVGIWEDMSEDGHGLRVKGRLLPTTLGNDLYILLKGGAIKGLSIGYKVTDSVGRIRPDDPKRRIKSAILSEVSLVNDPMNPEARTTSVKSADDLKAEITKLSDLGDVLREAAGWSKSQTEAVLSNFQAKANRGEPDVAEIAAVLRRNLTILQG